MARCGNGKKNVVDYYFFLLHCLRASRKQSIKFLLTLIFKILDKRSKSCALGFLEYPAFIEEAKNHDLFLSHSIRGSDGETEGGVPVTFIEMSASGMPVLSTLHCDIPEVIRNNESGFLVPEKDVDALIDRLEYLVTHPEKWGEMGHAGRKHIEQEYDSKKQATKLEKIYDGLV